MKKDIFIQTKGKQTNEFDSFAGGKPKLPIEESIPKCTLCSSEQTFFFQVDFPIGHIWEGFSLAVFACTSCVDEENLIPEMLSVPLKGATIPDNMLINYQTNFKLLVFPTERGVIKNTYQEKIKFSRFITGFQPIDSQRFCSFRDTPRWILEDECPKEYENSAMKFLFQVHINLEFPILKSAPQQKNVDYGVPWPDMDHYMLFNQNEIYFFGKERPSNEIYVLTQVD